MRRDDDVDVFGIGFAGIERRRVHEHELARKRPRHEHEHGIPQLRSRPGRTDLVPPAIVGKRESLFLLAIAHVNRKARAPCNVIG